MTTTPLYLHIASELQARLDNGEFPPGCRLPSLRTLAQHYRVNVLTVLAAYRQLEQQQRVVARPRAGFYAALPGASSRQTQTPAVPLPSPAAWVNVSSRMSTLIQLSSSAIQYQLHMAEAVSELYPTQELAQQLQQALLRQPTLIDTHLSPQDQQHLHREIARLAASWQLELAENQILVTHGITEAISLALRHLTRPGDTVAVETPVYFGLLQTLESLGLKALEIPCTPDSGLSLEALEFALRHGPAVKCLVCVPNFQNPTGALMPDEHKKRLLALARRHGVTVIEDDVFGDLYFGQQRPTPLKAWDRDGDVIYCASFTKSFAPAFRLGWLSGGRHHAALTRLRDSSSLAASSLLQRVLADALTSGEYARRSARLRQQLAQQMQQLADAVLAAFPHGTQVRRPQGGMLLWVQGPEALDSNQLLQRALQQSISFAPGVVFSAEPRFNHCLRLKFGQPWSPGLADAIATLGRLAREQLAGA